MAVKKKTTRKKATVKKTSIKRAPVRKKVSTKKTRATQGGPRVRAIAEKQTKLQVIADIADETGIGKKEVATVFSALATKMHQHLKARGSGEFTIPDTGVKVRRVTKPRTKARMGRNPFTGEEIKIPAKPARKVVKLSALKALKEML